MILLLAAADMDPLPPQTPQPREDITMSTGDNPSTVGRDESGDLIWGIPPAESRNQDNYGNGGEGWPIIVAPEIDIHGGGYWPRPDPRPGPRPDLRPRPEPWR